MTSLSVNIFYHRHDFRFIDVDNERFESKRSSASNKVDIAELIIVNSNNQANRWKQSNPDISCLTPERIRLGVPVSGSSTFVHWQMKKPVGCYRQGSWTRASGVERFKTVHTHLNCRCTLWIFINSHLALSRLSIAIHGWCWSTHLSNYFSPSLVKIFELTRLRSLRCLLCVSLYFISTDPKLDIGHLPDLSAILIRNVNCGL